MSEKSIRRGAETDGGTPAEPPSETVARASQKPLAPSLAADNGAITLQTLIDILPDYFWIKDSAGRFVVVNKSLAENNSFEKTSDMVGLSDFDIHAVDIAEEFYAEEQDIIRTGLPRIGREETVVEGGSAKWLSTTKFPFRDQQDRIVGLLGLSRDITETMRVKSELNRAQKFWRSVVQNVPDAIIVKDVVNRRYTMMNRAAEELIGVSQSSAVGKTAEDIYPAKYAELIRQEDDELMKAGELTIDNHEMCFHEGEARVVTVTRKLLRDERGDPQFMLAVLHDITERRRAEERVAYLAEHDTLTGLPNRAVFGERLNEAIERAKVRGSSFALMGIDLDRLKEVNDMFGHAAGDHLIAEVAHRFSALASGTFAARLGGDEFAIITEDVETVSNLVAFTDRLSAVVSCELNIDGAKYCPSISVGVAIYPNDGHDATTLLANSDAALYRAKADGRSRSRFFECGMDMQLRNRRALRHDLHFAIERGELSIHYQPKAKISGEVIGFEALLRWNHPSRGWVSPAEFIPAAEESRLIVEIGEWVLRKVCKEACSWPLRLNVAVNLSPVQFQYGDLTNLVHSILLETGLAANRLGLEITEGVLITDSTRALTVLRQLKAFGVRIVIIDFGKGYSSLSYLQLFPFDKIKIDRDFIHNVCHNHQSAAIVRAVLGLARALGLPVLAEGVETREELEFLRALGCDEIQGYLIGRPAPIEQYYEQLGRVPELVNAVSF